jgi:hypothetical protein
MDMDEQISFITERLSKNVSPDDIIIELCQQGGISWPEAEMLVEQVQAEQQHEIARRQYPLLALLSLTTFLAGLVIVAYAVYDLLEHVDLYLQTGPVHLSVVLILWYLIQSAPVLLLLLLSGTAMVIGSYRGVRRLIEMLRCA